jgi:hypothetical protein
MIHRKNRHLRSKRRGMAALAGACILFLTGAGAHAQTVKAGEVSGTLVSASALAGDTVLTVPSDKAFVLTQWCSEDIRAFELRAGSLVIPSSINADSCATYRPGIVVAGGTEITCSPTGAFSFGEHCLVTGVLTSPR